MKLSVASVHKDSVTAGLSPYDDRRTEVFLAGCRMALDGHPCPGCFNKDLWDPQWFQQVEVDALAEDIVSIGNPYITVVGGEPLDQSEALGELLRRLKQHGFCHITLITHYEFETVADAYPGVMQYADTIIDGRYEADKRIFDEDKRPGIYHVIGSSNQHVWTRKGLNWYNVTERDLRCAYY